MGAIGFAIDLAERGLLPDALVRAGIRSLLRERLRSEDRGGPERRQETLEAFVGGMRSSPVALSTERPNEQHYELPPEFFLRALGPRLKYSCCLWETATDLAAAEEAMLRMTCERAAVADGMDILDLGCGWGSLSLWLAERYPAARILAVSNSSLQREHIAEACRRRGLRNLRAVTADMNRFEPEETFDRVVSVEMFEHMRNWEELLGRIARWMRPDGRLFVHVFCHREVAYPFDLEGPADWMARHFFTGGMMPSAGLLLRCQRDLEVERQWVVDGRHYRKTCRAWLANADAARREILECFRRVYGDAEAGRWLRRWRIFFIACEELFGYRNGSEWFVSHSLLRARSQACATS